MISGTRAHLTAEIGRQSRLAQEIARAQSDISSTKRLQAASDDPAAAARVADIRQTQADQKAYAANVETAATIASQADATLDGVDRLIVRARELILLSGNDTKTDSDRAAYAVELRGIADDLVTASQGKDSRGYALFPAGDALLIPVSPGVRVAATASVDDVFGGVVTGAGPMSIEQVVRAAADAAVITDRSARNTALTLSTADIEAVTDHLALVRGEQGVRAARIDAVRERLAQGGLLLTEERGNLEGTDIPATAARLNALQLSLDAAQAVFARVNRKTLFDLLG